MAQQPRGDRLAGRVSRHALQAGGQLVERDAPADVALRGQAEEAVAGTVCRKIVERVVEKPVVTEKIVQVPSQEKALYELFENVYFDFDKADITGASLATVDKIARIMLSDTQKRYLITGCTDARGSQQYNMMLSKKRADAVVEALVQRGVPAERLKSRGVGKKISYAAGSCSTDIRRGDRKILVEVITNMDYWNYIP